jgi:hypothetical protein
VWLNAWHDPVAGLKTHGGCVRLVDLYGDGDSKLLVADQERKLTVYKGTTEHALGCDRLIAARETCTAAV